MPKSISQCPLVLSTVYRSKFFLRCSLRCSVRKMCTILAMLITTGAHATPDLNYATRVVLVTELKTTVAGTQLAFKRPGGCVFSGVATDAKVVDITQKTCGNSTTKVKMVVPLERQKAFIDAGGAWPEFDWINDDRLNYLLFPVEPEAPAQKTS